MKILCLIFISSLLVISCAKKEEEDSFITTRYTLVSLECQSDLTGICDSNIASAHNKTAYIYYLNNNCNTLDPSNNGLSLNDVEAYAKVTMDCDGLGCIGSSATWYDINDTMITNPSASGQLGNRSFVAFIDINSDAQVSNGIDGFGPGDAISTCSDLESDEPYGNHSLLNFSVIQ